MARKRSSRRMSRKHSTRKSAKHGGARRRASTRASTKRSRRGSRKGSRRGSRRGSTRGRKGLSPLDATIQSLGLLRKKLDDPLREPYDPRGPNDSSKSKKVFDEE
jgi:hypothetical protein